MGTNSPKTMVKIVYSALLSALTLFAGVEGAALGMDFGDEFAKMTIVRPGTGFQIVENVQSGRKTSNMLSFLDKSRTFGDDAAAHTSKSPTKVFSFPKAYLFTPSNSKPSIGFEGYDHYFPVDAVVDEERGVWKYKFDGEDSFSGEELVGQLLGFYNTLGQATNKNAPVRDVVIAIPADFNQRQRQSLADAAHLGGLDVLAFVTETTAAAVHRAIDWKPSTDGGVDVGLYINVGSRFTEACVIETSIKANVPRKGTNSTEVRNLGCHAEPGVGGYIGDLLIAEEMAKRFETKYKRSLANEPLKGSRVYKKLLREAKKAKHVLSTNKSSGFYVEGLVSDVDFKEEITRDRFEELLESQLTSKVLKPIEEAIKGAKVDFKDITTVEVIGGGWRSPILIQKIQNYLSEQSQLAGLPVPIELGQHLNGEEAMAFGASFVAANFSSLFRIKSMLLTDTSGHDVTAHVFDGEGKTVASNLPLVMKHSPLTKGYRQIELPALNSLQTGNITITISEDGIPLQDYVVMPPKDLENIKKMAAEGEISYKLKINVDQLGLVSIAGGAVAVTPSATTTTSSTEAPANATASNSTVAEVKPKTYALKADILKYYSPLPMNAEQKKSAAARLALLTKNDKEISDASAARNELEAFVYDTKNKYDGWEAYEKVTTSSEREDIVNALDAAESWLYDEGFGLSATDFLVEIQKQSAPLKAQVGAAFERARELELRPKGEELMKKLRSKVESQVNNNLPAWISAEAKSAVLLQVTEIEEWFAEKQKLQADAKLTQTPIYYYKEVTSKVQKIVRKIDALKQTPKPKETTTTTTTTKVASEKDKSKSAAEEGKIEENTQDSSNSKSEETVPEETVSDENKLDTEEVKVEDEKKNDEL